MKFQGVHRPAFGPRGGMIIRASIHVQSDDESVGLHLIIDAAKRAKWTKEHDKLFDELVNKLKGT